jgi:hypothetical protein
MKALVTSVSAAFALLLLPWSAAHALRLPAARHCPVFPANNAWNQRVDKLPVAPASDQLIASIGPDAPVHADFGSGKWDGGPIGIPFDVVSRTTPLRRVSFEYAGESDRVRYPMPRHVHVEGGSDRHALLLDRDSCRLYELFALHHGARGWSAGSGAVWNLRRPRPRPAGWTSADAAGLPILPLLARYDEVRRGAIRHALRISVPHSRSAFVFPARHAAGDGDDPALARMGERLRLKASVDISRFPRQARIVLRALKRYGAIVADNGAPWFITGAPDRHWSNDQLHTLGRLHGSDFEVVRVLRR